MSTKFRHQDWREMSLKILDTIFQFQKQRFYHVLTEFCFIPSETVLAALCATTVLPFEFFCWYISVKAWLNNIYLWESNFYSYSYLKTNKNQAGNRPGWSNKQLTIKKDMKKAEQETINPSRKQHEIKF